MVDGAHRAWSARYGRSQAAGRICPRAGRNACMYDRLRPCESAAQLAGEIGTGDEYESESVARCSALRSDSSCHEGGLVGSFMGPPVELLLKHIWISSKLVAPSQVLDYQSRLSRLLDAHGGTRRDAGKVQGDQPGSCPGGSRRSRVRTLSPNRDGAHTSRNNVADVTVVCISGEYGHVARPREPSFFAPPGGRQIPACRRRTISTPAFRIRRSDYLPHA
jgi:hypothetical protein